MELTRTKPLRNKLIRPERSSKQSRMKRALSNPYSVMRPLLKNSLYRFMKYFWDAYSNDEFVPNWHIEKICEELEKVGRRVASKQPKLYDLIINVPPGTTKTATVSIFFPIWCWVNWYWMRFITTSHSDDLSLESAEYSRDIIRGEKFHDMFPEIDIKQDKDKKSNFRVVLKQQVYLGQVPRIHQGGGRVSTSVKGNITGFHAHIIIPDDIIDPKKAISDAEIKTANHYLDQTLSTRKTDKEVSTMVMIMQRLAQNDPTGHLLDKKKQNIHHICLPGEIENYREQVRPSELVKYYVDNLLDINRMNWNVLKDLEADLGQYGYAGQIGQKPTPPGGGMFKIDHFQVILQMPSLTNTVQSVRYWDKAGTDANEAGGKGKRACWTVGTKMHKIANGKLIISDVKRGKWSSEERERIIRETAEADGPGVEIGVEQEPGSGGKESAEGTIRNLMGFSVYAECPTGDKVYRADPYSVQVNNGNVQLLKGDWNSEFVKEHENFPFSTYKDQVDSASGAFHRMTAKQKIENLLKKR